MVKQAGISLIRIENIRRLPRNIHNIKRFADNSDND